MRLEGGLGDHLLGNRFVLPILDKFPGAEIHAFSDSEGNVFQQEAVLAGYSRLYTSFTVINKKKYKPFWINCQFGSDNYFGALENVPDDVREAMEGFDRFYDLHIDSLKWLGYDFDWLRYFYFFPKPEIKEKYDGELPEKYAVFHLVSETSVGHRLEKWYIEGLINKIKEKIPCVVISTPKTNHFFDGLKDVTVINTTVSKIYDIISRASVMVGTDSGFRYIAYGCGIPTITFSAQSVGPHQVLPSHEIRWLLFPKMCFPLNFDFVYVSEIVKNTLDNKGYALVPFVRDFDRQMVRRKYEIDFERSVPTNI